jgi:hypothetical protein
MLYEARPTDPFTLFRGLFSVPAGWRAGLLDSRAPSGTRRPDVCPALRMTSIGNVTITNALREQ